MGATQTFGLAGNEIEAAIGQGGLPYIPPIRLLDLAILIETVNLTLNLLAQFLELFSVQFQIL